MNGDIPSGIIFGPVPSRRLGRSLGINNIPPKHCSYSCIYCQIGRVGKMETARQVFYDPVYIAEETVKKINEAREKSEPVDFISFVPDGEPALDINLGMTIDLLKRTGIKIAVITNASLLPGKDVRDDLMGADWVSLKVDAVSESIWRRINRPHRELDIKKIHEGMMEFAECYKGCLVTETMLVKDFNTGEDELSAVADFIMLLKPQMSYISIPTRPPAETAALPPDEFSVNIAWQIFTGKGLRAECITGYEGNTFAQTGEIIEDILAITSVHPMREEGLRFLLFGAGAEWSLVEQLVREDKISETEYNGIKYYIRRFKKMEI